MDIPIKDESDLLKDLNDEQIKVTEIKSQRVLVIAGAGTGKTRAITYRVARLIINGAAPERIYLATFTKKAAEEMITRMKKLIGDKAKRIHAGTFHHLANLCLREYAKEMGFSKSFSIYDKRKQKTLMKEILADFTDERTSNLVFDHKDVLKIYSKMAAVGQKLNEVVDKNFPTLVKYIDLIKRALDEFYRRKKENNAMDFDDLLVNYLEFISNRTPGRRYLQQWDHILVDEYQDVNVVQAGIIDTLAMYATSLVVVGDDAQAIFGFRGASVEFMLRFHERHAGVTNYPLLVNYRSTPEILQVANASISHNKNQFRKNLTAINPSGPRPIAETFNNPNEEAEFIAVKIEDLNAQKGIQYCQQAILIRSKWQILPIEHALTKHHISYIIRGAKSFFDRSHIQDVLNFLTLFDNPNDQIVWAEILSLFPGIGISRASQIVRSIFPRKSVPLFKVDPITKFLYVNTSRLFKKGTKNEEMLKSLDSLKLFLKDFRNHQNIQPLPQQLKTIGDFLLLTYQEGLLKKEEIAKDFEELRGFSLIYSDRAQFLSEMQLVASDVAQEKENQVIISTLHKAKGLQWQAVFLAGLHEDAFPDYRMIDPLELLEEERRLFYVGITRAKKFLILSWPTSVLVGENYKKVERSRFVTEIIGQGLFDGEGSILKNNGKNQITPISSYPKSFNDYFRELLEEKSKVHCFIIKLKDIEIPLIDQDAGIVNALIHDESSIVNVLINGKSKTLRHSCKDFTTDFIEKKVFCSHIGALFRLLQKTHGDFALELVKSMQESKQHWTFIQN